MPAPQYKIFLATILNPKSDRQCQLIKAGALVLKRTTNQGHKIIDIGPAQHMLKAYGSKRSRELIDYRRYLLLPALYDMHFHWVQDEVRLMPKNSLLAWLAKHTWPYESKFKNKQFSKNKAKKLAQELKQVGTIGGACYASIHGHTVGDALKAFTGDYVVGNVLMTMNSPDYLTVSGAKTLGLVKKLAQKFTKNYALTPRFAPTVAPEIMLQSAKLAKRQGSFIQTHLAETKQEIDYVLGLFRALPGYEQVKTYTEIYNRCQILGPKTILGHCIHLAPTELQLLKKTKSIIAHCPSSNAPVKELGLGSGLFDFKQAERYQIPWVLASDIGGGPYLSMFDVMRSFVQQNKKHKRKGATYTKALYRSTLASAEALQMAKHNGNLDPGKWANFICIPMPKTQGPITAESLLKQSIEQHQHKRANYDHLVAATYYRGQCIFKA